MNHLLSDGSTSGVRAMLRVVGGAPMRRGLTDRKGTRFCGTVDQLQLGDLVRFHRGEFVVRGLSPRTVLPGRVILENLATGQQIEVAIGEIDDPTPAPGMRIGTDAEQLPH